MNDSTSGNIIAAFTIITVEAADIAPQDARQLRWSSNMSKPMRSHRQSERILRRALIPRLPGTIRYRRPRDRDSVGHHTRSHIDLDCRLRALRTRCGDSHFRAIHSQHPPGTHHHLVSSHYWNSIAPHYHMPHQDMTLDTFQAHRANWVGCRCSSTQVHSARQPKVERIHRSARLPIDNPHILSQDCLEHHGRTDHPPHNPHRRYTPRVAVVRPHRFQDNQLRHAQDHIGRWDHQHRPIRVDNRRHESHRRHRRDHPYNSLAGYSQHRGRCLQIRLRRQSSSRPDLSEK